MTNQEKIESTLRKYVKRQGVEDLIAGLASSDFYTAPASTRFHDSEEGGLAKHTMKVCKILMEDMVNDNQYDKESVVLVAICHDLCKIGFYATEKANRKNEQGKWESYDRYTVNDLFPVGHGEKSVIMLMKLMQLTDDEIIAIRWHMGGFKAQDEGFALNKAFETCPLAVHLHIADLKATYL